MLERLGDRAHELATRGAQRACGLPHQRLEPGEILGEAVGVVDEQALGPLDATRAHRSLRRGDQVRVGTQEGGPCGARRRCGAVRGRRSGRDPARDRGEAVERLRQLRPEGVLRPVGQQYLEQREGHDTEGEALQPRADRRVGRRDARGDHEEQRERGRHAHRPAPGDGGEGRGEGNEEGQHRRGRRRVGHHRAQRDETGGDEAGQQQVAHLAERRPPQLGNRSETDGPDHREEPELEVVGDQHAEEEARRAGERDPRGAPERRSAGSQPREARPQVSGAGVRRGRHGGDSSPARAHPAARLHAPRRRGGVVTQRPAKPCTPVRFRSSPSLHKRDRAVIARARYPGCTPRSEVRVGCR